jgi:hypothetical protein
MALDPALEAAIRQAVREQGQKPALAERMIAWLEELGQGGLSVSDGDAFYARLISAVSMDEDKNAD